MTYDKIIIRYTNADGKCYSERTIETTPENHPSVLQACITLLPLMSANHPLLDGMIELEYDGDKTTMVSTYRNSQNINLTAKVWS